MSGIDSGRVNTDIIASDILDFNGDVVRVQVDGISAVGVLLTGAIAALVIPQVSVDGTTWTNVYAYPVSGGESTLLLGAGTNYMVPVAGMRYFQVISAFYTGGSTTVDIKASPASPVLFNGNVRVTQPTAAAANAPMLPGISNYGLLNIKQEQAVLAHWGKNFFCTNNFVSAGVVAETPMVLFRNPLGSTIRCIFRRIVFTAPNASEVRFRIYMSPTITANGAALNVIGGRQTGQTANQGLVTSLPTIAANGTVFYTTRVPVQAGDNYLNFDYSFMLEANNSFLITEQQNTAGQPGSISIEWTEQP